MQSLIKQINLIAKSELQNRRQIPPQKQWKNLARKEQLPPPGDWFIWLIMAGRGFGKTRCGAETLRLWIEEGRYKNIALIGETYDEARKVMVEGVSGLMSVFPPTIKPLFLSSKREIIFPKGAKADIFSAENSGELRGPQFDLAWIDEVAKFRNPQEILDQLSFSLRLGPCPRIIMTTTPRATPFIKNLVKRADLKLTTGSSFDNAANLPPSFLANIKACYGHTSLGRQEIYGKILSSQDENLWRPQDIVYLDYTWAQAWMQKYRTVYDNISNLLEVKHCSKTAYSPHITSLILAIDPAVSSTQASCETGIILIGIDSNSKLIILGDFSVKSSPEKWTLIIKQLWQIFNIDTIVVESNQGGDMVRGLMATMGIACEIKSLRATKSKIARANPVASLYKQKRLYHICPLPKLEEQMLDATQSGPPKMSDRLDALVWAVTYSFSLVNKAQLKVWSY